jgi:hypothetical protein
MLVWLRQKFYLALFGVRQVRDLVAWHSDTWLGGVALLRLRAVKWSYLHWGSRRWGRRR